MIEDNSFYSKSTSLYENSKNIKQQQQQQQKHVG